MRSCFYQLHIEVYLIQARDFGSSTAIGAYLTAHLRQSKSYLNPPAGLQNPKPPHGLRYMRLSKMDLNSFEYKETIPLTRPVRATDTSRSDDQQCADVRKIILLSYSQVSSKMAEQCHDNARTGYLRFCNSKVLVQIPREPDCQ